MNDNIRLRSWNRKDIESVVQDLNSIAEKVNAVEKRYFQGVEQVVCPIAGNVRVKIFNRTNSAVLASAVDYSKFRFGMNSIFHYSGLSLALSTEAGLSSAMDIPYDITVPEGVETEANTAFILFREEFGSGSGLSVSDFTMLLEVAPR